MKMKFPMLNRAFSLKLKKISAFFFCGDKAFLDFCFPSYNILISKSFGLTFNLELCSLFYMDLKTSCKGSSEALSLFFSIENFYGQM